MSFKKQISLTDVLIGIAIISLLFSIVVFRNKDTTENDFVVSVEMDKKNIQTAVDRYMMDNSKEFPCNGEPTELTPCVIDFEVLYSNYLKKVPKDDGVNYWIDFNGKVWVSTADSPKNVRKEQDKVLWDQEPEAVAYDLYDLENSSHTDGSRHENNSRIKKINSLSENYHEGKEGKIYLVSSIDKYGFISAPVGDGYLGYKIFKDNNRPIAKISKLPDKDIDTTTQIIWDYKDSVDPDGDSIVKAEWKGSKTLYNKEGEYTVNLRVKDSKGTWSYWTSETFTVSLNTNKPIAVISMTPFNSLTPNTTIQWSSASSYDPNSFFIVSEEWEGANSQYEEGTYAVSMRVQNSEGIWSEWARIIINIK